MEKRGAFVEGCQRFGTLAYAVSEELLCRAYTGEKGVWNSEVCRNMDSSRKTVALFAAIAVAACMVVAVVFALAFPHYSGVARIYEQARGTANAKAAADYVLQKYGDEATVVSAEPVRPKGEGGIASIGEPLYLAYATDYLVGVDDGEFTVRALYSNDGLRADPVGKLNAVSFADDRQAGEISDAIAAHVAGKLGLAKPIKSMRTPADNGFYTESFDGDIRPWLKRTTQETLVLPEGSGVEDVRVADMVDFFEDEEWGYAPRIWLYEVREGSDLPDGDREGEWFFWFNSKAVERMTYFGKVPKGESYSISACTFESVGMLGDVRADDVEAIGEALPDGWEFATGVYGLDGCPGAIASSYGDSVALFVPREEWNAMQERYSELMTVSCPEAPTAQSRASWLRWSAPTAKEYDYVLVWLDVPKDGTFAIAGKAAVQ